MRAFGRYVLSECGRYDLISFEMTGPRELQLGGLVEDMGENVLTITKKFLNLSTYTGSDWWTTGASSEPLG